MFTAYTQLYTPPKLYNLNHQRPPARGMRKALYTHHLWAPASVCHMTSRVTEHARNCLHSPRCHPRTRLRTGWLNYVRSAKVCRLLFTI